MHECALHNSYQIMTCPIRLGSPFTNYHLYYTIIVYTYVRSTSGTRNATSEANPWDFGHK
jgi:hypothetical protein